MNRTLSSLAVAAVLTGSVLAGCGGATSPGAGGTGSSAAVTAAVTASAKEMNPSAPTGTAKEREATDSQFVTFLNQLRQVPALAPLFELYAIPNPIVIVDDVQNAGLIELLQAVRFAVSQGTLTITNRATGGVIYTAPMTDLAAGTFHPENLPSVPQPPTGVGSTCTSFTYSPWSTCGASGTQTRTVLTSSPSGCTGGSPVTAETCTPTAATCTSFTYSTWGACDPATSTQTRTVLSSSPTNCTGGSPVTTQACTPPPATCTSFTYSAWGACSASGTQTRTVLTSSPASCTGGSPVTTQACTPPPVACTAFTYSAWGACDPATSTQTRTVLTSSPASCTGGSPVTTQACTPPPVTCTSFTYSAWGTCSASGTQTRTVLTSSPASCTGGSPVTTQTCTPPIDGAALYGQYCSGCHGPLATSNLKGKAISLTLIKQFNMTQGLTDAQLQAIVTAVGP